MDERFPSILSRPEGLAEFQRGCLSRTVCRLDGRGGDTLLTHFLHSPCRNQKGTLTFNTGIREASKSDFAQAGHPAAAIPASTVWESAQGECGGVTSS